MKLALGGAQFGMSYGVANTKGQLKADETSDILQLAYRQGVRLVDTAVLYGESEATLGIAGVQHWKVVSKLPELPAEVTGREAVAHWVHHQVEGSLKRLRIQALYGLLLHRPLQLLGVQGADLYHALLETKAKKMVKKIGVSIYEPNELEHLFASMHFDLIQAPMNILDQRLLVSGWAERLEKMEVEVHVRSAFLQGLLLMSDNIRPFKFEAFQPIWNIWNDWLRINALTPLEACLSFVTQMPAVHQVVVGVDSFEHLSKILQVRSVSLTNLPNWGSVDPRLINPAMWDTL